MQATMQVTASQDGKRIPVGTVKVYVPTLADIVGFCNAEPKGTDEEGLPVYESNEANWVMAALRGHAFSNARNKLQKGSVELKPGNVIPADFATLSEPTVAGGGGEGLVQINELKRRFKEYANSLGKSAGVVTLITGLFDSTKYMAQQSPEMRAKLVPYYEGFVTWLDNVGQADDLTQVQVNYIERVIEACTAEADTDALADL